ncbi:MAG: RdgB/HAM1 family non-canonical purine NTP pyrophosphatase [Synergistaceae bacterium]|nr:RdgB/HAM1 family non-canonical purine NTP pyrophosphatase [Synergistaceae bacterium]MBQ3448549.1 RdgB/HAM1 family non-canonical purine NTP pyrophosphatase [Synergistaceae bacterium]MBQ3693948.1 RdgB/HAM1 family non-canonical purine NTP pyrophosphatase [Synergistaceae bacterium]MBQ6111431.1 RdgB/HAM1 family non-canonical purine NTP pyrophosphatase [Synergistaceae bacterium]MBQ9629601.1 RdgB/HAM1 family non-canonical purine NTP pyrophosphatase [Synergistaceae bacterium]
MIFDKLIIATGNAGKYKEFTQIIRSCSDEFANEIIFAPEIASMIVDETGKSYSENAMLKAKAWSEKSGLPCLADDSGLEVKALDGAPGLYSARIIQGNDDNKISWLLHELANESNRNARFAASLALSVPDEYMLITEGHCYGTIADSPNGINGFGYDPVFIPDGYKKTFAELSSSIKNQISHRADAFRKIISFLKK